jgi:hypothetical protein
MAHASLWASAQWIQLKSSTSCTEATCVHGWSRPPLGGRLPSGGRRRESLRSYGCLTSGIGGMTRWAPCAASLRPAEQNSSICNMHAQCLFLAVCGLLRQLSVFDKHWLTHPGCLPVCWLLGLSRRRPETALQRLLILDLHPERCVAPRRVRRGLTPAAAPSPPLDRALHIRAPRAQTLLSQD